MLGWELSISVWLTSSTSFPWPCLSLIEKIATSIEVESFCIVLLQRKILKLIRMARAEKNNVPFAMYVLPVFWAPPPPWQFMTVGSHDAMSSPALTWFYLIFFLLFQSLQLFSSLSFLCPSLKTLSFAPLICPSLYQSLNELKLSTSHKGSTIFLLLNIRSNVHCPPSHGTFVYNRGGRLNVCVHKVGVPPTPL